MNRTKKCVECGSYVPPYQNFFCEECWEKALNEKLKEDEKKKGVKHGAKA
ncbi:hypothetical protein [Neobacillus massiliamazoniensis]|uniref:Uncharacterized protein n=1 Tax=Neobacillus massiliamazoniensis TaxID=1499688 RepID=A0A0U1NQK7_9BACI|nr:hypothetical protein [Neobacillus massiliamazoniensis]CRK80333.1 hypothetical protein BN000_00214 [Neobacillus massiliamazoniensis]